MSKSCAPPSGAEEDTLDTEVKKFWRLVAEDLECAHAKFANKVLAEPTPSGHYRATLRYITATFDVQAHHRVSLVTSYDDINEWYEPDLDGLMEQCVKDGSDRTNILHPDLQEGFLQELRILLAGRKSHWTTEAMAAARIASTTSFDVRDSQANDLRLANSTTEPQQNESSGEDRTPALKAENSISGRRAAVDAYIAEVGEKTGKQITRADIWRRARFKTRTEFERWERCDRRATATADQRFTNIILVEKPHLKKDSPPPIDEKLQLK